MHVEKMTRRQFEALPHRRDCDTGNRKYHSLVILPSRTLHDSGYRCMDFVAVGQDGEPICRLSGGSDVLHINGIGGWGKRGYYDATLPKEESFRLIPSVGWSMDCLPKSGLLRLFCMNGHELTDAGAYSSFEVFAELPAMAAPSK